MTEKGNGPLFNEAYCAAVAVIGTAVFTVVMITIPLPIALGLLFGVPILCGVLVRIARRGRPAEKQKLLTDPKPSN